MLRFNVFFEINQPQVLRPGDLGCAMMCLALHTLGSTARPHRLFALRAAARQNTADRHAGTLVVSSSFLAAASGLGSEPEAHELHLEHVHFGLG